MASAFEEKLNRILMFVDGHVKFAEAKNAALFTLNASTIFAVSQVFPEKAATWLSLYLGCVLVGSFMSGIIILLSFLPATQIPWGKSSPMITSSRNLLFFSDLVDCPIDNYLADFASAEGESDRKASGLERMYAEQIIANGRIAARKFAYFKIAIWTTLFGVVTPTGAAILLIWDLAKEP